MLTRSRASILASFLPILGCEHQARAVRDGSPEPASAASTDPVPTAAPSPVLVELYTSQGCSSCPPADHLLTELARDPGEIPVIPLAFHVDYWNDLGWPDPFSDPRWTQRQLAHAAARGSTRIYTPQLLFDGQDHQVGTRAARVRAALRAQAAQAPTVDLPLDLRRTGDALDVIVRPRWRDEAPRQPLVLMVAVTDGGHRTVIPTGENAGLTLDGEFVVRDLVRAGTLHPDQDTAEVRATLSLAVLDHPETMRVVAFAQDEDRRIRGVAAR